MRSSFGMACAVIGSAALIWSLAAAEQAHKPAHKAAPAKTSALSGPSKRPVYIPSTPRNGVVIYNGNQKQTRIFNSSTDPSAPVRNLAPAVVAVVTEGSKTQSARPVVIGISSGVQTTQPVVLDVASSGSSAQPVVLGVADSGFQTAGTVESVTVGISPRPAKRPPYRPAALDRQ